MVWIYGQGRGIFFVSPRQNLEKLGTRNLPYEGVERESLLPSVVETLGYSDTNSNMKQERSTSHVDIFFAWNTSTDVLDTWHGKGRMERNVASIDARVLHYGESLDYRNANT